MYVRTERKSAAHWPAGWTRWAGDGGWGRTERHAWGTGGRCAAAGTQRRWHRWIMRPPHLPDSHGSGCCARSPCVCAALRCVPCTMLPRGHPQFLGPASPPPPAPLSCCRSAPSACSPRASVPPTARPATRGRTGMGTAPPPRPARCVCGPRVQGVPACCQPCHVAATLAALPPPPHMFPLRSLPGRLLAALRTGQLQRARGRRRLLEVPPPARMPTMLGPRRARPAPPAPPAPPGER